MKKSVPKRVLMRFRTATVTDLPLFPLNVVLFPGMMLPLHIFEPRYQEMIDYCLEKKRPFGVVLIERATGRRARRCPIVGTTARIRRVKRQEDGRMDIQTVGVQRFRIEELDYSQAYLSATCSADADAQRRDTAGRQLAQQVRPQAARVHGPALTRPAADLQTWLHSRTIPRRWPL